MDEKITFLLKCLVDQKKHIPLQSLKERVRF
jgi:hypothetical protein